MTAYHHRYSCIDCPHCGKSLTRYDGIIIEVGFSDQSWRLSTSLDDEGNLLDVHGEIAKGSHRDTFCSNCYRSLSEFEIFDPVPEQLEIRIVVYRPTDKAVAADIYTKTNHQEESRVHCGQGLATVQLAIESAVEWISQFDGWSMK